MGNDGSGAVYTINSPLYFQYLIKQKNNTNWFTDMIIFGVNSIVHYFYKAFLHIIQQKMN